MRKRRLLIVLIAGVVVLALGGGAVYLRSRTLDQQARESRVQGMEAAQAGDYVTALHKVGSYLQRFGQEGDTEALVAYARARRNVPLPNGRHYKDAIGMLRRALEFDPGHAEAQGELLDLYLEMGYGEETRALAEKILESDPDNVAALRAESVALARLGELEKALEMAAQVTEREPGEIQTHTFVLGLMQQLGRPVEDIRGYADKQPGLDPAGAPYQLVKAAAHELTGDRAGAVEWAERAAENVSNDVTQVTFTYLLLNGLGQHRSALTLLDRAANETGDPELERLLVRSLFESGDMQRVLDRTDEAAPADQDATVLALRAVGLADRGETDEVKAIAAELEGRNDDNAAKAWAPLLKAMFVDKLPPQEVVAVCQEALSREPANPYFHYFIGWAYNQQRETDLALRSWEQASKLSPAWADPLARSAEILASSGRTEEAVSRSFAALERAPQNIGVAAIVADVLDDEYERMSEDDRQKLLELVEKIQTARPGEPRSLPLLIDLLARLRGAGEARVRLETALASDAEFTEACLLRLAQVSDAHGLGLAEACRDRLEQSMGSTASLTYARAIEAHEAGDSEGGRKLLTAAAAAAGDTPDWRAAVAQYLEVIGAEDAPAAWARVSDAAPDNAALQQRVLASEAAWTDLALIERVVERLQTATGDNAVAWRVAKARWLLQSDPSAKAAAEATTLMTDAMRISQPNSEYHATMAAALERLGDREGAIENLTKAAQLDPNARAVRFELVRLHQARGDAREAERYLDDIARMGDLSPVDTRRLAALTAAQGRVDRAIEILETSSTPDNRDAQAELLLAQLYARSNRLDQAEAIVDRLLAGEPDAPTLAFAADLLALRGRADEAEAALARLDGIDLEPGLRELLRAEYVRKYGEPDEAARLYDAARAASPGNPTAWRRSIDLALRTGNSERAVALILEARAACPEDKLFEDLTADEARLRAVAARPVALPFLLAALETPDRVPEALECLKVVAEAPDDGKLAMDLRQLSDRYPRFLPLKVQLARLYRSLGRHSDAAQVASQAMREFPGVADTARLAAETHAAVGQWDNALDAAREWRARSGSNTREPDLLIAGVLTQVGRSAEALQMLQPYLTELDAAPEAFEAVPYLYARALVGAGRVDEAEELLAPRVDVSDQWRMAWMRLAGSDIADAGAAAEWLDKVAPEVPESATDERVTLALAWYSLAERSGNEAHRDRARQVLDNLSGLPDVSGTALLALGIAAERNQDLKTAEATYRLALRLDSSLAVAKNNLAMMLATRGESLDEALELAQDAVTAEPRNASFIDTLGFVYAARGDYAAAVKHLEDAVKLEPGQPQWRERLAELQQRQREESTASTG